MSLNDDLLIYLTSYHKGYKLMRARIGGYEGSPNALFRKQYKNKKVEDVTIRATIFRLKKLGFIERDDFWWCITKKGKKYLLKKQAKQLPQHTKPNIAQIKKPKHMIIVFDIPEKSRRKRDWLRRELVFLGFVMLQKSVWLGPSPLPKDFIENGKSMHILQYMKFFHANEVDIV